MVVNHAYNEGYRSVAWGVEAADDELLVIHALGVRRACSGRGLARRWPAASSRWPGPRD